MATKEKKDSANGEDDFRKEQLAAAKDQNLQSPNAVPEQRPIASQQVAEPESETVQRLREEGELQEEPMGQEAYEKADSDSQAKKAAKESRSVPLAEGQRVKIVDGPYEGNFGAITGVQYASVEDERLHAAGTDESRFAEVAEYQVRTRGGRHALVFLEPDQVEPVEQTAYDRGVA